MTKSFPVCFLRAQNGVDLAKRYSAKNGFTAYPNVKNVSSKQQQLTLDAAGLGSFEKLLLKYGNNGHCLLKGLLKRPLINESRAGVTDRIAYSNLLVLDIDGIELPDTKLPNQFDAKIVAKLAKIILQEFPKAIQNCSFIAQASASLGLKNTKVSLHVFMFLSTAVPPKTIKLWLQAMNFESQLFAEQVELSSNGHSLKYPLDISVADNSKLIFIAAPRFEDEICNPFASRAERIVLVPGKTDTFDLAKLMKKISPEIIHRKASDLRAKLRKARGCDNKKERITLTSMDSGLVEVLHNPDRMSITVADDSNAPFIRCNINGGDSGAYFFNLDDPIYMRNFKGEPLWEIEKGDPDFYASIFDIYEKNLKKEGRTQMPIVMRDYHTDTYYNGVFDPDLNQFTDEYPLTPCAQSSVEGFMRSHSRTKPDFVPDAKVVFDPVTKKSAVNLKKVPYEINMFRATKYMLSRKRHAPLTMDDTAKISDSCPLIYKLVTHIVGGQTLEAAYFINWLAYVFQTKQKAMTAWVLQGVQGTGKGIFYTKVLRPLFGEQHVPMRALQNLEEQFNLYMRHALFLVVDEFHMASSSTGITKMADKLKNAITETTMTIRAMRSNQIELPSFTNFIFLTNRVDAIKIEEGDRRYNIAPRQEQKLQTVYPEVIAGIDDIDDELMTFAALLRTFKVDRAKVRTPLENVAKTVMTEVAMSVSEEFFTAIKKGNLEYFLDVLDISVTNVLQSQEIITAQRFVKTWIAESLLPYSVVPMEHQRLVYSVLTEDRMSPREFQKRAQRVGLKKQRKRPYGVAREQNGVWGVVNKWELNESKFVEIVDKYFEDKDKKLLLGAWNERPDSRAK